MEKQEQTNNFKTITWILTAVAVVLAGVLAYIWIQKSALVDELNEEKAELTQQML